MGRPLPRKFFEQEDLRIPVLANLGNGNVDAWLVGQERTGAYWATDGVDRLLVVLVDYEPETAGQAQCIVETVDGDKNVRQINMNDVKTFDGNTLKWVYADPITGQGAFKASGDEGKAKDEDADPFTIALNSVYDRADPGLNVTDAEAQYSFTIPPGDYSGDMRIIFFSGIYPDAPRLLGSSYNSGGTFYVTVNATGSDTQIYAKIREDDGDSTPTLLISNTLDIKYITPILYANGFKVAPGSQSSGDYSTASTTPDLFADFPQDSGPVVGATFYVICHLDDQDLEPQDTVRYTKVLNNTDITNGITFKVSGTLVPGEHIFRTYYKNPNGDFSASTFQVINVEAP